MKAVPFWLLLITALLYLVECAVLPSSSSDFLSLGDAALAADDVSGAIEHYNQAISILKDDDPPIIAISLYTNLGTALSSIGRNTEALELYKTAVMLHSDLTETITESEVQIEVTKIAAQASFYLGMVLQDMGSLNKAANAYAYAGALDPYHWASLGNLGALLQDELHNPIDAVAAYNKAYDILTQTEVEPTDAPPEPRYILSQLQYRIGMVRFLVCVSLMVNLLPTCSPVNSLIDHANDVSTLIPSSTERL